MIRVDRNRVVMPARWRNLARAETDKIRAHARAATFRRYEYNIRIWRNARGALHELFRHKCAYCESPLRTIQSGEVQNFRPPREARGAGGHSSPLHYCWLAYEWDNLYLVCTGCSRTKRNLFPVDGNRCPPFAALVRVHQERAILIDPCWDDPEKHLGYRFMESTSQVLVVPKDRRGEVTIEMIGLNRPDLARARYAAAETLKTLLDRYATHAAVRAIGEMTDAGAPYAGMIRQLSLEFSRGKPAHPSLSRLSWARQIRPSARRVRRSTTEPAVTRNARVSTIDIENFRALRSFRYIFLPEETSAESEPAATEPPAAATPPPAPAKPQTPWLVLLGENSTGKSSLLQALAVALEGERALRKRRWKPSDVLHRKGTRQATRGHIRVGFTHGDHVEITFDKRGIRFKQGPHGARTYVRAYGATRLPPRPGDREDQKNPGLTWTDNLFDPWVALCEPELWFARYGQGNLAARRVLDDMLGAAQQDIKVEEARRSLIVRLDGTRFSWRELSDGFQSILCLCADLVRGVPGTQDMNEASGIVLLDEIGTHLHPKWKMRIVNSLRSAFPLMQFVVTTHEPLCLRGLRQGEIVLLKRERGTVTATDDLPAPENFRVDQLLTSRLFGLESTIDPVLDQKFHEYYTLLDKGDTKSPRFVALRSELAGHGILGYTRRDQLIYDMLDQFLAREMRLAAKERKKLSASTLKKVAAVWTKVEAYVGRQA